MRRQLAPALRMLILLTLVTGLAYPLAMTGLAQLLFRDQANGSLVKNDGQVVGSRLMGQEFVGEQWFHSRPSAAGAGASGSMVPVLDAAGAETVDAEGDPVLAPADIGDVANNVSGFSSLGPTNPELLTAVAERVEAYRQVNDLPADAVVPVDAVTTSGSGVDPHISVANARLQAPRVAAARKLPIAQVLDLVGTNTDARSLAFLGEPGVNVLELNLAIQAAAP